MRLTVRRPAGRLRLELIRAGRPHRCEIDLSSGLAQLSRDDSPVGPAAPTGITQAGTHDLTFANVDGRLTLWVDGELPFGQGVSYPTRPEPGSPTPADLEPARIAARQADMAVSELVLRRDVYYTIDPAEADYDDLDVRASVDSADFFDLLSDAERFSRLPQRTARDYSIGPGHYLMLGDNSPRSRDARAWGRADQVDPAHPGRGWDDSGRASWEVPERLLIGKAFCIYVPQLKPVWPNIRLGEDLRVPVLPYIGRMRWIR